MAVWLWIGGGLAVLYFAGKLGLYLYAVKVALHNATTTRTATVPGDVAAVDQVDHEELESRTAELIALGFTMLGDVISKSEPDPALPQKGWVVSRTTGVGRIFAHPTHGCYANLTSAVTVTTELDCDGSESGPTTMVAPFSMAVISLSGNDPESWSYSTGNRAVEPLGVLCRHRRGLSQCVEGASAERLLQAHLKERDPIAKRGEFEWDQQPTFAKYQAYEDRVLPHLESVYRHTKPTRLLWLMLTFRLRNHNRWMGELGRV